MAKRAEPPRTLHERAERTRAVVGRFRSKPFDWAKAATCYHLVRAQLVAFGYKAKAVPAFRTPLGAKGALKKLGAASLEQLMDNHGCMRIPPAMMIVGDVALLPSEGPFDALAIYGGGGELFGWHGDDASSLRSFSMPATDIIAAWRL